MENQMKKNQTKSLIALVAAAVFMAAVYSVPTETFFEIFAAGLVLIPAMFFVYIVQKVASA